MEPHNRGSPFDKMNGIERVKYINETSRLAENKLYGKDRLDADQLRVVIRLLEAEPRPTGNSLHD